VNVIPICPHDNTPKPGSRAGDLQADKLTLLTGLPVLAHLGGYLLVP